MAKVSSGGGGKKKASALSFIKSGDMVQGTAILKMNKYKNPWAKAAYTLTHPGVLGVATRQQKRRSTAAVNKEMAGYANTVVKAVTAKKNYPAIHKKRGK